MVDSAAAKGEEDHHRHDRDTPRHDGAGIGPLGVLDHGREDARSTDHPEQRNVLMEGEPHLLIHQQQALFQGGAFCGLRPCDWRCDPPAAWRLTGQ